MVGPTGLAFNSSGDLFVGETAQISDPSETYWDLVLEFTYNASTGAFSALGTAMGQEGRVNEGISALAVDGQGDLFVADIINNTGVNEFKINSATGTYSPLGTFIGAASGALAVDGAGDVFIANPGNAPGVLEYLRNQATGSYPATGVAVPGATQLSQIVVGALAVNKANDLFAADGDQVLEFTYNPATGTYAATGTVVAGAGGTGGDPASWPGWAAWRWTLTATCSSPTRPTPASRNIS